MPFSVSHFEVAKKMDLTNPDFHVGNIIPDVNHYTHLLSKEQTHFIVSEPIRIYGDIEGFIKRNITFKTLDEKSYYFALGYLAHIITDRTWGEMFYLPVFSRYKDEKERTRRYFSTQLKLLNTLFARWEETKYMKEEFLDLKKYHFHETALPYPFTQVNVKKMPEFLKAIIDSQFTIKHSYSFHDEELYRYEKELKRYIDDQYYELFLEQAVSNIKEIFEHYQLNY